MTSNLLSLNSSITEFLLIELRRQLSKIHSSSTSIDTTQSARNLGFIFDEHLSFYDHIYLHCLNPAIITFVLSAVSVPTLTFTPQKTVATSIVHFKLDYCNSLYLRLPKFQIKSSHTSRMLLLELLSRLQNSNTSLLF